MVLLVIDAQIWLTNKDLYCYERFVNGTKKVIEAARENNIEPESVKLSCFFTGTA